MPTDIFISYRRSDAAGHARLLHKDLAQVFDAERLFFDRETIESGMDFPPTLSHAVAEAKVLLAVIASQWLAVADENGQRRLDDPGDFVRKEIALALGQGKKVIPVLLDDAPMPAAQALPEDLKPLASRDALTLRGKNYEYDRQLAELVRLIAATPGVAQPRRLAESVPERAFRGSEQVLSPHFCGRDAELGEIDAVFGSAASDRPVAVALWGMGGSGKTQVALRYGLDHASLYAGVWWFRAQSSALLEEDFGELVRACQVPKADEREPAREAVLRWLARQPRWLLVFDNAEDAEGIRGALPERGPHHALITSCNPAWGGLATPLEVRPWNAVLAVAFLERRLPGKTEPSRRALSEDLGGLPLALEQACAYCEEVGLRVDQYRQRLQQAGAKLLAKGKPGTGYPGSIARTVSVAFERLSPPAAQLMQHLAWFAPEPVADEVFLAQPELLPEPLGDAVAAELDFDDLVAELRKLGLAERIAASGDRDPGSAALRLHRLTRAVVRDLPADAGVIVPTVVGLIEAASPDGQEPAHWPRWAALMPHILDGALNEMAAQVAPEMWARILNSLGLYQHATGRFAPSRDSFQASLKLRRSLLGTEHPDTLTSMGNLAGTLRAQGDLAGARELEERVLAARRRVLGEEHPATLTSMGNLAGTLSDQGDLAGARELEERVLAARRRVLGEEHPATLTSMGNLAGTLKVQGDLAGARALQEQVLAARRRVLGEEHPATLTSMGNLAGTLSDQGDLAGARELEERVLAARRRVLGEEHPDTLISMNNLAATLRAQGDLAGARELQERVLAARRRVLGEEHPATLTSMGNLAGTLKAQGDLAGARALQEQVLAAHRRVLGEEHPATLTSMGNLAGTLSDQGDLAGARELEERVLAARRRVLGEEHPATLTSMGNLAGTLKVQGDLAGARALQEQVLAARRRVLGEEHPATLTSMGNLAATLSDQGDLAGARELEERVLAAHRRVLGEEHPDTLISMNNLAATLRAQGDLAGACELQEQVLAAHRRVLGDAHPDTTVSAWNLRSTLLATQQPDAAKDVFDACLAWLLAADPETLSANQRTVRDYLKELG